MGRELDVVVFGATGFAGRLTAEHLARHAPDGVRIGLAGRSAQRLAATRDSLGPRAAAWPTIVADVGDDASLATLAESTQVVATTVGPYLRYGLPLVAACAAAGTDCADLSGEVLFVRRCIDEHHEAAVATGARIVNSCGFDSIPSDLGVLVTAQRARADGVGELGDTTLAVTSMKAGVSGGTLDSRRVTVDAARSERGLRRLLGDPYGLSPDRAAEPDLGNERDRMDIRHDPEQGGWVGPFVMAPYNTRVVRRSNALQDWAYGRQFRYREVSRFGTGVAGRLRAHVTAGLVQGTLAGLTFWPTRAVLDRVLPKPGEGPDEKSLANGRFRMEIAARTTTGARYRTVVAAQGDPGYAATAVMLGESALCLALDRDRLPAAAGVLTPATAMGGALVERLRVAGFQLDVERV